MKVARGSFLGVLVVGILLTMFLTLHAHVASQVSTTTINELSPAMSVHEKVVNANSIVYWYSDHDWSRPIMLAQQGVYTGDTVALACYTRSSTVPSKNDPLWYWAEIISGRGQGAGWINNYFLNTVANQPNIPVNQVIVCPEDPYVWSNTGIANIRALPEDSSTVLDPPSPGNSTQIGPFCWLDGAWAKGNYWTNRWFQVQTTDLDAFHGYINASLLANQQTTPHCDASLDPQPGMISIVTLTQGPLYSGNTYRYAISLSGFPKNATISVKCYDSVSPSGFGSPFTMRTDANGESSLLSKCYSGDGPDHWVIAGSIISNYVQWGGGGNPNTPLANPTVTLAQGPSVSSGIYRYAIALSGFPANTSISVECYDSVSTSGFLHFTMATDGSGNASTQNECYSGDGPDHWVVAGGVTSNHIQWGGGGSNPLTPTLPPTPTPTPTPSRPVDAYSNYGPANVPGYPICRGNPNNSQSMPGGTVSQTFTVPAGVASLDNALVQIDPDPMVTAHLRLTVNGSVVATADAVAVGDTQFSFGPVSVNAGDVITLSISFTATSGKITTVYTAGSPSGTFTASDSCPDGASNVQFTNTGLRARVSGVS